MSRDRKEKLDFIKNQNLVNESHPNVVYGENCRIHPTASIGGSGYTMEMDDEGNWVRANQHGGVMIGDNVHIGEFSVIRRSTLEGTYTDIMDDVKICSYVNVGHNCVVGAHSFLGPHVCLNGSVTIGERSWLAGHSVIGQHSEVGCDVTVGMGAVVPERSVIPDRGTVIGVPAKPICYKDNHIHDSFIHGKNLKIGKYNHIHERVWVGDDVTIRSHVELRPGTVIGSRCYIDSGVKMSGECELGINVTVRYDSIIARNVTIEDDVFISPQVMFINIPFTEKKKKKTIIRKGVKIGTNATISDGVLINSGVIVGAKALVTKDLMEPGIYVGIPAKRRPLK